MKKIIALTLLAFLTGGIVSAQHGHGSCGNCPHHKQHQQAQQIKVQPKVNADGIDIDIVRAFPSAKSINKDKNWIEVYNANKKLLGYAVYSKPASDGIKGYAGETPVMITFDSKRVITGVWLLQNRETPSYAKHVEVSGFYKSWNGLTVEKALNLEVDAVSGATFTSNAVAKSVHAALSQL